MKRALLPVVVFATLAALGCADEKKEPPKPAQSIAELRQQLEKIMTDSHTPGISVAVVRRDGAEWVAGLVKQPFPDPCLFSVVCSENQRERIGGASAIKCRFHGFKA